MVFQQSSLFTTDLPLSPDESAPPEPDGATKHAADFPLHLLAVGRVPGIGIHVLRALIRHYTDLATIWEEGVDDLRKVLTKAKARNSDTLAYTLNTHRQQLLNAAYEELQRLHESGVQILPATSPDFPARLAHIPDPPAWLFIQGQIAAIHTPLIGVVGTRKPSGTGLRTASWLVSILAQEGFGIVSGLAEGIDNIAHRTAFYYRVPQVAVLGTGIDIVFPASTRNARARLLDMGGAVISEYLPGDSYSRAQFVERNRIQAALSLALAPIESHEQSGTAHTVRFAEKYQRPIFGVRRSTPDPGNELVTILEAHGHPVFDLDRPHGIDELVAWLNNQIAPDLWPQQRYQLDRELLFQGMLKQLDYLRAYMPLNDEDLAWLQSQITLRSTSPPPAPEDLTNGR